MPTAITVGSQFDCSAVEAARQHQHPAVEDEPERERREAACDDRHVALGERAALVDEADDRLGEHRRDDRGGDQEEADLAQARADRGAEAVEVVARREPREGREEHRRDGDGEHPLREHVEPEGGVDRRRSEVGIDEARGEQRVDRPRSR